MSPVGGGDASPEDPDEVSQKLWGQVGKNVEVGEVLPSLVIGCEEELY